MKFTHKTTGVVIDVDEDTAKTLGSEWQAAAKPRGRRKTDEE